MSWIKEGEPFILKSGSSEIKYKMSGGVLLVNAPAFFNKEWVIDCDSDISHSDCRSLKRDECCILHQPEIYQDDIQYLKGGNNERAKIS